MEPEIPVEITERVRRGALLLDGVFPKWPARLDTEILWLGSCTRCVLGQLFGDYVDGAHALGWAVAGIVLSADAHDLAISHGFTIGDPPTDDWTALRSAWLVEIDRRLAKPTKPAGPTRRKRTAAVAAAVPMLCTV